MKDIYVRNFPVCYTFLYIKYIYSYIFKSRKIEKWKINAIDFECPSLKLWNAFYESLNHIVVFTSKQGITHTYKCKTAFTRNEFDTVKVRQEDVLMIILILSRKQNINAIPI